MDLIQTLPSFGGATFTVLAFIVAISIIVAVHEYGHYIVGRWSGIHAEVFSLGFGPVLFSRVDRRGTRWQVAALPLGGYVKFLGDANAASVGSTEVGEADRRRTMLGAPLWARAATVAAGPAFNFVFSFLLFAAVLFSQGRPADPLSVGELTPLPDSFEQTLLPGDEVLAVAGQALEGGQFPADLPVEPAPVWTIVRDGETIEIAAPYPFPSLLGSINPGSAAYDGGLRPGDVVTAVGGDPVYAFDQLVDAVRESGGAPMDLTVWRDGESFDVTLTPRRTDLPLPGGGFETRWLLGAGADLMFTPVMERSGPVEAFVQSGQQIGFIVSSSLSGMWHILTGAISTCNLSGPVGIAETSGQMASQGTVSFLWFLGVISVAVGLLNLFPVPVLDGGHLMFHAWEAVTGRMPSDGALRVMMAAGLAIVLALMCFALLNDLILCP
ncbi:RIP metalloprotease RseP [Wenxinia saemankumensis]|uniref:Zinc metalloprotease n=1 Tax=Wenxinia saemankumensis TaxID=1447782 RepID=A0A1M6A0F2_9RHOB|nr:RIP metalloprotease RseP [Wenxinia saemankumensis]SHI30002.1 regulator of sigma E protease [Wenxinia saemankumensis]